LDALFKKNILFGILIRDIKKRSPAFQGFFILVTSKPFEPVPVVGVRSEHTGK
tara:strand:+ start:255 stop:413 length:159 start_codon:yes stop_codon:yes gene_type:complete